MSKAKPLFSIVTPVYNNTKYLEDAVRSVLKQSFSDFEYIIVDDGSTDATPELVDKLASEDSRIKAIHQENQWIYASYNNGVKEACGEYVLFVNSDDRLRPGILEYAAKRVKEYEHPDVLWAIEVMNKCDDESNILEADIYGICEKVKEDVYYSSPEEFRLNWMYLYFFLFVKNPVNFYKRELLLEHPFRNDIYAADLHFNIEIAPLIERSVLLSYPAYDYYERMNLDNPSASGNKYYEYSNDMFNEFYKKIIVMISNWNVMDDNTKKQLQLERLSLLNKQFICISNETCKKSILEKVKEVISYAQDEIITECATSLGMMQSVYNEALTVIRNMVFEGFSASDGRDRNLYALLDKILTMQEQGESAEKIICDLSRMYS